MKIDLSKTRTQLIFLLLSVAFAAWMIVAFVDFIQTQRTREAFAAIGRANVARQKQIDRVEAAEAYVTALRAINLNYTKSELRPAFAAYLHGLEEGLVLLKSGKSTTPADAKIAAAHRELVAIAKRCD